MITKNYIVDSELPINANVSDNKVNPYLSPARKQLKEILDADLYSALQSLYDDGVKEWSKNNSYSTDDKVIHSELGELKMWKAAQDNSNSEPTTANAANWDELDLGTFLVGYVQPFLAHHVFYAYAVNGGVNITHQGLQVVSNETAQPLGGSALQSFLNYWKSELGNRKREMFNYLDDKNNTLDAVSYTEIESDRKTSTFQIRPIGNTNY